MNRLTHDVADTKLTTERLSACVYTTLIGNYEKLNEQPLAIASRLPFICFTDDAQLHSDTWQIRQVSRLFSTDLIRSQRSLKINPHNYLAEFDVSLFIDNTVILKTDPEAFLNENMDASGFSLPHHSYRSTVLDEFITVLDGQLDDPNRIFEQFDEYSLNYPSILREKPYWTGILLRDHRNSAVRAVSEIWFLHVLRYSRRDQLSINLAFRQAGLSPKTLLIDNEESCFHSWPRSQFRKHEARRWNNANSPAPSAVRISQKVAKEALAIKTGHRAHLLARHVEARRQIKKARARIKVLEGALASAREESATDRNRYQAIVTSSAWKATAPLRVFGSWCLRLTRFGVLNRDSTIESTRTGTKVSILDLEARRGVRTAISGQARTGAGRR